MARMAEVTGRLAGMVLGVAVAAYGTSATLNAGPATKVTYISATTTVACNLNQSCPALADGTVWNGIMGDGGAYIGNTTTLLGSFFYLMDATNTTPAIADLKILLKATANPVRYLHFDFTHPNTGASCGTACNFAGKGRSLAVSETNYNSSGFRPLNLDGTAVDGGMFGMAVGAPYFANMWFNFTYSGVDYTLRFMPGFVANSCRLTAKRTTETTWEFYTDSACDYANLVGSGAKGKQYNEGSFHMPFKITVTQ